MTKLDKNLQSKKEVAYEELGEKLIVLCGEKGAAIVHELQNFAKKRESSLNPP